MLRDLLRPASTSDVRHHCSQSGNRCFLRSPRRALLTGSSLTVTVANSRLVNQNTENSRDPVTERFDILQPSRDRHLGNPYHRGRPQREREVAEVERTDGSSPSVELRSVGQTKAAKYLNCCLSARCHESNKEQPKHLCRELATDGQVNKEDRNSKQQECRDEPDQIRNAMQHITFVCASLRSDSQLHIGFMNMWHPRIGRSKT